MEEKKRYINQVFGIKGHYKEYVFDTYLSDKIEFNECYKVLNQQDKRIKELEAKIHLLNEQSQNNYEKYVNVLKENQQLTDKDKEQNQKAIEQLQELLEKTKTLNLMVKSDHYVNQKQVNVIFEDIIMQKISELKGDENEKEN